METVDNAGWSITIDIEGTNHNQIIEKTWQIIEVEDIIDTATRLKMVNLRHRAILPSWTFNSIVQRLLFSELKRQVKYQSLASPG